MQIKIGCEKEQEQVNETCHEHVANSSKELFALGEARFASARIKPREWEVYYNNFNSNGIMEIYFNGCRRLSEVIEAQESFNGMPGWIEVYRREGPNFSIKFENGQPETEKLYGDVKFIL